jgi:hypothetical protein
MTQQGLVDRIICNTSNVVEVGVAAGQTVDTLGDEVGQFVPGPFPAPAHPAGSD